MEIFMTPALLAVVIFMGLIGIAALWNRRQGDCEIREFEKQHNVRLRKA